MNGKREYANSTDKNKPGKICVELPRVTGATNKKTLVEPQGNMSVDDEKSSKSPPYDWN
jgi:hypothetical protein